MKNDPHKGQGPMFKNDPNINLPSAWGAFRPMTGQAELDSSRYNVQRGMSNILGQNAGAGTRANLAKQGSAMNSGARERMALAAGRQNLGNLANAQAKGLNQQAQIRSAVESDNINFLKKLFDMQVKYQAAMMQNKMFEDDKK